MSKKEVSTGSNPPNLHCSPFLHKWWKHLIFKIIYLLCKIPFRCPWFYAKLLTERDPLFSKLRCFRQCLKCQHSSTIIWNITWDLVDRVVHCKNGKNSVCSHQRRLLQRINCTDININRAKLWRLAFFLIPEKWRISMNCKCAQMQTKRKVVFRLLASGTICPDKFPCQWEATLGTDQESMKQQTKSHKLLRWATVHMHHSQDAWPDNERRIQEQQVESWWSFGKDWFGSMELAIFLTRAVLPHPFWPMSDTNNFQWSAILAYFKHYGIGNGNINN